MAETQILKNQVKHLTEHITSAVLIITKLDVKHRYNKLINEKDKEVPPEIMEQFQVLMDLFIETKATEILNDIIPPEMLASKLRHSLRIGIPRSVSFR